MEKTHLGRLFSASRLTRFYAVAQQDTAEAAALYAGNIRLSESLYPVLTVVEVGLRNAIHWQLSHFFQTADWYRQIGQMPGLAGLQPALAKAEDHIKMRREVVTAHKLVAELNAGFWATLFNRADERTYHGNSCELLSRTYPRPNGSGPR